MNALAAYEHACELWGSAAGVWSPGPGRFLVGRWLPLAELVGPYVLRVEHQNTRSGDPTQNRPPPGKALQVLGEGASWAEAFAAARVLEDRYLLAVAERGAAQ